MPSMRGRFRSILECALRPQGGSIVVKLLYWTYPS